MLISIPSVVFIPAALVIGWMVGSKSKKGDLDLDVPKNVVPRDYLLGLNYLINEQPDKAVDVFIKMLQVNDDTVETHLALGILFRRRGEVDRAIRIHQNLIARPNLPHEQRVDAMLALAEDYMRAGVLDRAERIFQEVIDLDPQAINSLRFLMDIYQQEKAWKQAIETAKRYERMANQNLSQIIAQYYCELAENPNNTSNEKYYYFNKALHIDVKCVRANIGLAQLSLQDRKPQVALSYLRKIAMESQEYLPEVLKDIVTCYEILEQQEELKKFLELLLDDTPKFYAVSTYVTLLQKLNRNEEAIQYLLNFLQKYPSIRGLNALIQMQLQQQQILSTANALSLLEACQNVLSNQSAYRCLDCGFSSKTLHWLCPSCQHWCSIKPLEDD